MSDERSTLTYRFPLTESVDAFFVLPRDLTSREVERMGQYLRSLVPDERGVAVEAAARRTTT